MPKTDLLVISDSFSISMIDEVVKKEANYHELYGLLSAPELIKILALKEESMLQDEFLFSIRSLKRILKFKKILIIGHYSYHDILLMERIASFVNGNFFSKDQIEFLAFEIVKNQIKIFKTENHYSIDLNPELTFSCSDPRIVKMHLESYSSSINPLGTKNNLFACLPGSTMLFSRSFGRNYLRVYFNRFLVEKNINKVLIEHHSDCGAYREHYNDKLNNGLSLYKQSKDMEKFYKLARCFGYFVSARFLDFNDTENSIVEKNFAVEENGIVSINDVRKISYDFEKNIFLEKIPA